MRLLHTSDWHIGRQTYGVSRRPDHEAVFEEIVGLAREWKPHLIIHSGDVFETSRPSVDDLKLAQEALLRLSELAPVLVIAGNHDSPAFFDLFAELLGPKSRLRYVGAVRAPGAGGVLEFPGEGREVVRVAALPFVHANRVVDALEQGPEIRTLTYADRLHRMQLAFAQALEKGYHPERHILMLAAHLFVEGSLWSKSERALHVGETYATRVAAIPHVSYAAFGHIHKPQALPGAPGRYAGSPLQLDFGEEGETKETVLVEAFPGRGARIESVPLSGGRPLITLRGRKEALEGREVTGLLRLTVETDEPTQGLTEWATRAFPKATLLEVAESCAKGRTVALDELEALVQGDLATSFAAYVNEHPPDGVAVEGLCEFFNGALLGLDSGEELPDPVELVRLEEVLAPASTPERSSPEEALSAH